MMKLTVYGTNDNVSQTDTFKDHGKFQQALVQKLYCEFGEMNFKHRA